MKDCHLPFTILGATAIGIGIGFWACSSAHAGGLDEVPAYTSPCTAPLLSRAAYRASVFGPYEESFYGFYRMRRKDLCGDPLHTPGVYVAPGPAQFTPYRPVAVDIPPGWYCAFDCFGGGGHGETPPPIIPDPPSQVPLPWSGVLLLAALLFTFNLKSTHESA